MGATLVTMVPGAGAGSPWLDECMESARLSGGTHVVVEADEGFFAGRRTTYRFGGVVACLDWDDRVLPGAVDACERAMSEARVAVAFTWQRRIYAQGGTLDERIAPVVRRHLTDIPDSIHHLACVRTDLVPDGLLDVIERVAPLCVDWIVKAYLSLKYGAVQVPMIGYEWRQHENQASQVMNGEYAEQIPLARALIRTWSHIDSRQFEPFLVWGGLH